MTENEFLALGRAGFNRIPLHLETFADLDTPLSIYLKLANRPGSYLLESVIGGERFGRYSFIGLPSREVLRVYGRSAEVRRFARVSRLPIASSSRSKSFTMVRMAPTWLARSAFSDEAAVSISRCSDIVALR